MTFSIHGLAVSRGIAIGRAVLVASSRADVAHYFVAPEDTAAEIIRVRTARNAVIEEITRLQADLPADAPQEIDALLDVHLMLLQDEQLISGVKRWIAERHYNAEWALVTQYEALARQFDEMEDEYLRERKADLEQVVERILRRMKGVPATLLEQQQQQQQQQLRNSKNRKPGAERLARQEDLLLADIDDVPLVLVAHDISPADMLQFRQSLFVGFATDVGGKTSHTAIVARSMDIPAVVGARSASQLIAQDDWVIIDGDAGVLIVDPSPIILAEYGFKQRQGDLERERLNRLRHTPAVTLDGQRIELLANIELPGDTTGAVQAGAVGVGLFRSEFLFMNRDGQLPDEDEQYAAYCAVIDGMRGMPVTIRTVDIGADKPLDRLAERAQDGHLNPAMGLRAIRWSLADPPMFLTQLRAILRSAAQGPVSLLVPMLAHAHEIHQTLALIAQAQAQLQQQGKPYGPVRLGAMIEIPAAALSLPLFLRHFDFLSVGTNDLIQYTLAIDRADESVAHLYDPCHPAVLGLLAATISAGNAAHKSVCVCGEMAGDVQMTRLLLGLGLRSFSMHPSRILAVKQQVLRADAGKLESWAQQVLQSEDPAALLSVANEALSG